MTRGDATNETLCEGVHLDFKGGAVRHVGVAFTGASQPTPDMFETIFDSPSLYRIIEFHMAER